nr:MAG TPA: hypothetical protein [Caudoviricetes sp.]
MCSSSEAYSIGCRTSEQPPQTTPANQRWTQQEKFGNRCSE